MKSIFVALLAMVVVPVMAMNPHDAGVSRRHHALQHRAEEVTLPAEEGFSEIHANGTMVLTRRAFTNARASYYAAGLGACGRRNSGSDFIVALNAAQFGSGHPGPNCFRKLRMSYRGKTAIAEVTDRCPGCPYGGLDCTVGLFSHFASLGTGIIYVQWEWLDEASQPDPPPRPTSTPRPRPTTTTRRTTTTTRRSSTTTRRSTTRSSTRTQGNAPTATGTTTTTTSTPTPTGPSNIDNVFQALLQMTELLRVSSDLAHADD